MNKPLRLILPAVCAGMIATPVMEEAQNEVKQFNTDLINQITQWLDQNGQFQDCKENIEALKQTTTLLNYHLKNRPVIKADGSTYDVKEIWRSPVDAIYYGIGDDRNDYYGAWAMREYKGALYIGSMDISTLIEPVLNSSLFGSGDDKGKKLMNIVLGAFNKFSQWKDPAGYNLYCLDDPSSPLKCITNDGFGNPYAYGIRNLGYLDDKLVIGTANPQTLSEGAGGQVLLFSTDAESGIKQVEYVPMSVCMRQHENCIELAAVDSAKKIESVDLYTLSGMKVASETPDAHEAYLIISDLVTGTYILNAKIGSEIFVRKIFIK